VLKAHSRQSASSAAPIIERSVQEAINTSVIPKFTQATQNLIDTLSREMRAEILSVRKEIVSEQSILLQDLIDDVRQLKLAMGPGSLPSQSPLYSEPQKPQQSLEHRPPPPIRSTTPLETYEDILLKMLSEPDATSQLARYVAEAPGHRAHQIFAGYEGKPAISQVRSEGEIEEADIKIGGSAFACS
jgi:vacuolar-type H+-ATPase subunit E/Vma4